MSMLPLPSLIRASAHDAGDDAMRKAGRAIWNDDDWNAMVATQDQLIAACYGAGIAGRWRFQVAEALQRAGRLTLRMTMKQFTAALDEAVAFQTACLVAV